MNHQIISGHIYFELVEACIDALEQNDEQKLSKSIPMYMLLAFMASDSKFLDPELDINIMSLIVSNFNCTERYNVSIGVYGFIWSLLITPDYLKWQFGEFDKMA